MRVNFFLGLLTNLCFVASLNFINPYINLNVDYINSEGTDKLTVYDFSKSNSTFMVKSSTDSRYLLKNNFTIPNLFQTFNNSCTKYSYSNLEVSNCSLVLNSQLTGEHMPFNLFSVQLNDNNSLTNQQFFIESNFIYNNSTSITVYPSILQNKFNFSLCNPSTCEFWGQQNISNFDNFAFKLIVDNSISNKYDVVVKQANLIVKNYGTPVETLKYYGDITNLIDQSGNVTSFSFENLPEVFDLQFVYSLRTKLGQVYTSQDMFKNYDQITIEVKNIQWPVMYGNLEDSPNSGPFLVMLSFAFSFLGISFLIIWIRKFLVVVKEKNKEK